MSRTVAAVLAVAFALAAGAVGGAMFERSRRPAPGAAADARPQERPDGPAATAVPGAAPPLEGPPGAVVARGDASQKLADAQAEISKLKDRVAELEKQVPHEKTNEEKLATAKEIVECIRKGKRDPEGLRRLLRLITELDPVMGPYFIERMADPNETGDRGMLMGVTLGSGGPEVADWVLGRLTSTEISEDDRNRILRSLSGGGKEIFSIRNLPVKGPLADLAFQYTTSGTPVEREAGAGLLGGVSSVESRTALTRLAGSDTEWSVRESALRSLAYVGDKDTLTWLDTFQPTLAGLGDWEKKRLQAAVDFAREQIGKRSP